MVRQPRPRRLRLRLRLRLGPASAVPTEQRPPAAAGSPAPPRLPAAGTGAKPRRRGGSAALGAALVVGAAALGCQQDRSAERLLLPATTVVATNEVRGIVTADSLRVRAKPSVRAEVLSYLRRGEVVEVLRRGEEEERIGGDQGYWFEVTFEGVRGWAFGTHLDLLTPGATDAAVNARVEAARNRD